MDTIKDRLFKFLEHIDMKPFEFERACKLSNGFCSKINEKVRDSSLMLISNAFPQLNTDWLKTGFGDMLLPLEEPTYLEHSSDIQTLLKMMSEFVSLGKKNADANLINAEANKMNAKNLERLIELIENKILN